MTTLYYESELYHHGVKGMKWGVRKKRTWTSEPEGGSIQKQVNVLKAKTKVQNSKGSEKRTAKKELKTARKDLNSSFKEYRSFEKDMHKKVGSIKKLTSNNDGTYSNEKGKSFKEFEVEGARNYQTTKKIEKTKAFQAGMTAASITLSMIGAAAITNWIDNR